jgi:hypothetical protein
MWLMPRGTDLDPSEALALQGFSHVIQKTTGRTARELTYLAGNAFNGGVCLDLMSAVCGSVAWQSLATRLAARSCGLDASSTVWPSSGEGGKPASPSEHGVAELDSDCEMSSDSLADV